MDLKLILKTFSNLRRMTSDEVAFLETLRAMNESECEALVETLSPQPIKKAAKKPASKKSSRASSLEQQIQKRGRGVVVIDGDEDSEREVCTYEFPDSKGTRCGEGSDDNVHHRQSDPLFHPFVSTAPTASDQSSANGDALAQASDTQRTASSSRSDSREAGTDASPTTASSATETEDVLSAVHAGG